jgi:hypothetical protein
VMKHLSLASSLPHSLHNTSVFSTRKSQPCVSGASRCNEAGWLLYSQVSFLLARFVHSLDCPLWTLTGFSTVHDFCWRARYGLCHHLDIETDPCCCARCHLMDYVPSCRHIVTGREKNTRGVKEKNRLNIF